MRLPTNDVIAALGATVVRRERLPATIAVATDTRAIRPSETFLALRGERFDGHRFVAEAVANGASAAIVDDPAVIPPGIAGLVVADTRQAYLVLGRLARERVRGAVVGITGSTGKTTTKTFLASALAAGGRAVAATPENENNEIGVPKFLLSLDDGDERTAIVEMGCRHYRDIEPLVEAARPQVGILTNVGDAHLEIMGTRERLAETKWGLFAAGAHAVLNLADAVSLARAATLAQTPVWFGLDGERVPDGASGVIVRERDILIVRGDATTTAALALDVPGDHNRRNVAAALAASLALGLDPARIAAAGPSFATPAGRYERIALDGGVTLIYDAYNASASGALATLAAFAREPAERRIAVIGSMAELGAEAPVMHEQVGAAAARAADVVLAGGAFAERIAAGAEMAGRAASSIVRYDGNDAAVAWLRANVRAGDVVLLKGSRVYRMEQIVAGLHA